MLKIRLSASVLMFVLLTATAQAGPFEVARADEAPRSERLLESAWEWLTSLFASDGGEEPREEGAGQAPQKSGCTADPDGILCA